MRRPVKLTLVGVGLLLILMLIGNIVLLNALPTPVRLVEPLVFGYGIDDPRFRRTLGLIQARPVVGGNRIEVLRDGDSIFSSMLEAVQAAEHSVTFETYEFWGEASAGAMSEALAAAAERGVAVHAILDFVGSRLAASEKFERMEAAGVEVVRWRRPSWYQLPWLNHRTHRKLLITDGRVGFIGGANKADDWLATDETPAYRDNHFRLEGPVVGHLQAAFSEIWLDAEGTLLLGDAYYPELEEVGALPVQLVSSLPQAGRHRIRKQFMYAIAAAREQIWIGTAYFYPDGAFLDALVAASERGVAVNILVPGEKIDQGFVRHASANRWGPLLQAGVRIFEYQPSMYHSKLISIDDSWASVGSSNLDNRSFRINDEANINVFDADFARGIRQLIEDDLPRALEIDLESWEQRAWWKRAVGWFGSLIGAHL